MEDIHTTNCPFCNVEIMTSQSIKDFGAFVVITNIKPIVDEHIMVVPKRHIRDESEILPKEQSNYIKATKYAFQYIKEKTGKDSFIFINAPSDQSVFHFHKHFVPSGGLFGVHGVDTALRNFLHSKYSNTYEK